MRIQKIKFKHKPQVRRAIVCPFLEQFTGKAVGYKNTKMNKLQGLTILLILFHLNLNGQIQLVGAATNANGGIDILKWEALDPGSVTSFPSLLTGYYAGSSAFNAYNSNYYLTGITQSSQGLYSFNTQTQQQNLAPAGLFTNISEFDMSTGKLYEIRMDSTDYFSVRSFDIESGTDSLLGIMYEPGAAGLVFDAIGFDANHGILYYIGFTNAPDPHLYAIPVRDEVFAYTRTDLFPGGLYNSLSSLHYDNVNDKLFAVNTLWDSQGNFSGHEVVEIRVETGEIVTRAPLTGIIGFVASSSSFDQNTGSLLLSAIDTNFSLSMIVFNTYTNTYLSGFVPGNVSEIACDNTLFALNKYILTKMEEQAETDFLVFPNPASDRLWIRPGTSGPVNVRLFQTDGKVVFSQSFHDPENIGIPLRGFKPGTYFLNITSHSLSGTRKIVVK